MRRGGQQGSFLGMDAARPFSLNRWVHLGTTPQKDAGTFPHLFGVCETKKTIWNAGILFQILAMIGFLVDSMSLRTPV